MESKRVVFNNTVEAAAPSFCRSSRLPNIYLGRGVEWLCPLWMCFLSSVTACESGVLHPNSLSPNPTHLHLYTLLFIIIVVVVTGAVGARYRAHHCANARQVGSASRRGGGHVPRWSYEGRRTHHSYNWALLGGAHRPEIHPFLDFLQFSVSYSSSSFFFFPSLAPLPLFLLLSSPSSNFL